MDGWCEDRDVLYNTVLGGSDCKNGILSPTVRLGKKLLSGLALRSSKRREECLLLSASICLPQFAREEECILREIILFPSPKPAGGWAINGRFSADAASFGGHPQDRHLYPICARDALQFFLASPRAKKKRARPKNPISRSILLPFLLLHFSSHPSRDLCCRRPPRGGALT